VAVFHQIWELKSLCGGTHDITVSEALPAMPLTLTLDNHLQLEPAGAKPLCF